MITKRVNRYYCEFCKKANCSAASISRHEAACTMNPKRICRVCKFVRDDTPFGYRISDDRTPDTAALVALLPEITQFERDENGSFSGNAIIKSVNVALGPLRKATDNCPACIMAAIRQAKIPVSVATGFSFTDEMKSVWSDVNDAERMQEMHG